MGAPPAEPLDRAATAAWQVALEAMAAGVAAAVAGVVGTEEGTERLEIGAGGDRTAVVDRVAEDAVVAACERLAATGRRFRLRSEEMGDRSFGAELPLLLVDPVDGSHNAMFGIPFSCTSLALLDGPRLRDVALGVVRSLAAPTTFTATRGRGAWRDGRPLRPLRVGLDAHGRIPLLLVEAHRNLARPRHDALRLDALFDAAVRVRLLGSAALSLCQVAGGSASAMVAPDGMRAHDVAGAVCVLRELGAVVTDLDGEPVDAMPAELGGRTSLVASLDPAVHARVLELVT